jgi:hypothetical protein
MATREASGGTDGPMIDWTPIKRIGAILLLGAVVYLGWELSPSSAPQLADAPGHSRDLLVEILDTSNYNEK